MKNTHEDKELNPTDLRRLERYVQRAQLVLALEKIWPKFWPFLVSTSLALIFVLFDILPKLSSSFHVSIFGALLFSCVLCLAIPFRNFTLPTREQAIARLEKDSGLENQPLSTVLDRPVKMGRSKTSYTIWMHHQDRMARAIASMQLSAPVSHLGKRDPYSLRAGLIILLFLGVIEARFDWQERVARAFSPLEAKAISQGWQIQAWVTPPEHTRLGPIFLSAETQTQQVAAPVVIPQYSDLLVRLEGQSERDEFSVEIGPFKETLANLGNGVHSLETKIDQGSHMSVYRNQRLMFIWPIEIKADMPPSIEITKDPRTGFRGHVAVQFLAQDDYGLQKAELHIRKADAPEGEEIVLENKLSEPLVRSGFRRNLADHPWAGQDVIITPKVTDNSGQASFGQAHQIALPERAFKHPVAQRLVEIRKSLYESTPEGRVYARMWLDRVLEKPEEFDHNLKIYFPLRVASDRIDPDMADLQVASIQSIMWESAVQLDEGTSGNARNQLEHMSRQMQDLMNGAPQSREMEALFEQMRQSLDQFLQKMGENMPSMEGFEEADLSADDARMIGRDEMMSMLDRAREMMRQGNMEAARALMEEFQNIVSQLAMQQQTDPALAEKAQAIMKKLRALRDDQQKLLDKTFNRTRSADGPKGLEGTKAALKEAEEQEELQLQLREQMRALVALRAEISPALLEADRAMKRASTSLQHGLDEDAIQAETLALDRLKEGLKNSATSLAQKMGMQTVSRNLPGTDPMGRGSGRNIGNETGEVIPSELEMRKSREIMQELYRRAGQKSRSEQELEYLQRLLERF